ncbi:MAG: phage holin family protein [Methylotenera sp.]|nr:phage holin family protein [Methylotenera sp.]
MADEGLFVSIKNMAATLVAVVHTRLDILSTDLEEGRERLMSLLVMAFVSLFCLCVGVVLLAIFIVVAFWDTHRLLVLGLLTSIFLVAGAVLCGLAIRALKAMPRVFQASLDELSKDKQHLDSHK